MFISTRDADHSASRPSAALWVLAASVVMGSLSCADLEPADDSCATVDSCLQINEAPLQEPLWERDPERWDCLEPGYMPPMPFVPSTQPAVAHLGVVLDYATQRPLPAVSVKFCANTNPDCVASPDATVLPGSEETVPVMVSTITTGQLGFLRVTAPQYITQDYFLLAPMLQDDRSLAGPPPSFLFLVSDATIGGFINDVQASSNIVVNPALGIVSLAIVDCRGVRVEGAKITITEADLAARPDLSSARGFAINDLFPRLGAETDSEGISGLVNVPEGPLELQATIDGYNFGRTFLRIAGNRVTSGTIRPVYVTGR